MKAKKLVRAVGSVVIALAGVIGASVHAMPAQPPLEDQQGWKGAEVDR